MLLVLWEYEVKPDALDEFEPLYRPDGAWGDLMLQGPWFASSTLCNDRGNPRRFVGADRPRRAVL